MDIRIHVTMALTAGTITIGRRLGYVWETRYFGKGTRESGVEEHVTFTGHITIKFFARYHLTIM